MENNTNSATATSTATTITSAPSSSTVSRIVLLLLRVLTFVFLLIALIVIVLTKETLETSFGESEIKFNDIHAFRYMISTIVIGFAYNLLQMALSIFTVVSGNRVLSGDGGYMFDFFGDKIISYFLLSGSAAGFGASEDLHRIFKAGELPLNSFFGKANASTSLLLLGFLTTAIASIFTSFALPRRAK
ncbi:putative casparian strip membrane protein [Medicago truncatula]|uniref:CASP-like protein n=1 Tax=Medicago truncatula TaxID=3880 RepID=G7KXU9_MEDTR|nr:CASP-like protein 4D1 [Medicago truncatula]AES78114.1 plant integral membrane protein [Medicago truncatula]RHN44797.1 putative casparian strip membrane protein [Medicago truncatula]